MLQLALMSSENRAASTLARNYPGGVDAFVGAMNAKARALGMTRTRFEDPTGLSPNNVSTASDLARLVRASAQYPLIRDFSTTPSHYVEVQPTGRLLGFNNSNRLVSSADWDIQLQKTGYIREAGRCLVMLANVASKPMIIVLLDSIGSHPPGRRPARVLAGDGADAAGAGGHSAARGQGAGARQGQATQDLDGQSPCRRRCSPPRPASRHAPDAPDATPAAPTRRSQPFADTPRPRHRRGIVTAHRARRPLCPAVRPVSCAHGPPRVHAVDARCRHHGVHLRRR
jgi:hypothetical protein